MALTPTYSGLPLDLCFDLDLALTVGDASGGSSPAEAQVFHLPAVSKATGMCAVCMEEFEAGEGGKVTPCCHVYHDKCISAWLLRDRSCPLCRRQISPSQ